MRAGSAVATVNGQKLVLHMPVQELNGALYMPQAFAEALATARSGRTPPSPGRPS